MLSKDELEEIIGILDDMIIELETFCNDICDCDSCIDCNIHYVMDKLAEVIELLREW